MAPDEDDRLRALHMEDTDADRRQKPTPPPQTPGEEQGSGNYQDLPPGEEAGDAGKETRGT